MLRPSLCVLAFVFLACGGDTEPNVPTPVLTTVNVSLSAASLQVGQTATATATGVDQNGAAIAVGTVTWSTGSASIATVNSAGIVTAVAAGQTTVIASAGGKQGQQSITVVAPVASVTVTPASASLIVGATQQLTATILDAGGATLTGRTITWSTSDAAKATVSAAGLVTALAAGSATITATTEGKSGASTITVLAPVASVTVTPPSASLLIGATQQLAATTLDAGGSTLTGRTVTWTTSDAAKATVSSTGLVTAVAAGSATITATSEGKSGTSTVTVTAPLAPTTLRVVTQPAGATSNAFFTTQPVVEILDQNGARFTSATNAVTVSVGTGTGSLSGTVTVNAVAGVATFTDLAITGSGAHTLAFAATGLTGVSSTSVTVAASTGFRLLVGAAPSQTVTNNVDVTIPLNVEVATGSNLGSITLTATWDPTKFTYVSNSAGNWSGVSVTPNPANVATGSIQFSAFNATGTTTTVTVINLTLKPINTTSAAITATVSAAVSVAGTELGVPVTVTARNLQARINP
jgi:uncharacterized protein YjdB